ncbi:MAG: 1-acyl-sn-glycerol-3-phosphate acyltransferase [Acidobacteria bacterium]|nr:1-acyl-sn-glycerol-3-phosphate acyltransferase [Acidobacteriota bacterium]
MKPIAQAVISMLLMIVTAVVLVPVGVVTLFRSRRLYARVATVLARCILRVYGVRIRLQAPQRAKVGDLFPRSQVVYISNHTSTLDLFILVALGLPDCRFFLSGFLRKWIPLGFIAWMMGTFFTVPQDRPDERTRIFTNAGDVLRRTGESVYLSPEGGRITTGDIGHFNKGAFHLATVLRVPIVPLYFHIPREVDPGLGYQTGRGTVDVYVLPAIHTTDWKETDVVENKERVRALFVRTHQELRCA